MVGNKARLTALLTSIKHHIWSTSKCSKARKIDKSTQLEVKLCLFICNVIAYIGNTAEFTKMLWNKWFLTI